MINTLHEIKVTLDGYYLIVSLFGFAYYILLIVLRSLRPELSLNHKWKRVWDLVLTCKYFSDKTRTIHIDRVNRSEV